MDVGTCGTGLTISGSPNFALNTDYYADVFSQCGATGFQAKSGAPSAMRLGSSFIGPSCNYTVNQSCYWAVYDYPDQANLTARLHARCLDCPRPGLVQRVTPCADIYTRLYRLAGRVVSLLHVDELPFVLPLSVRGMRGMLESLSVYTVSLYDKCILYSVFCILYSVHI